jgi:hypothetical protein
MEAALHLAGVTIAETAVARYEKTYPGVTFVIDREQDSNPFLSCR